MTFGEKLQALRKARGWSQEELATQINVSRQALSKWESGASVPDTEPPVRRQHRLSAAGERGDHGAGRSDGCSIGGEQVADHAHRVAVHDDPRHSGEDRPAYLGLDPAAHCRI